jgi:voltage-gated potassium channel
MNFFRVLLTCGLLAAASARAVYAPIPEQDQGKDLTLTVAAAHLNHSAHIVVTLRDMVRARNFSYLDRKVQCVQWHSPRMATEELQDPGIAAVYADLMTHGGRNTYSTRLPDALAGTVVGELQTGIGRGFDATLLAVQLDGAVISPGWNSPLPAGAVLYYVGGRRLSPEDIVRSCAR